MIGKYMMFFNFKN